MRKRALSIFLGLLLICSCSLAVTHHRVVKHTVKHAIVRTLDPLPESTPQPTAPLLSDTTSSFGLNNGPIVVLPAEFAGKPVVVADSPEYKQLVSENSGLKVQLDTEQKEFITYRDSVDKTLAAKNVAEQNMAVALAKQEAKSSHFKLLGWEFGGIGLLGLLTIAGVVVLCAFNPAIIVSVVSIGVHVIRIVAGVFGKTLQGFEKITHWLSDFEKAHEAGTLNQTPLVTAQVPVTHSYSSPDLAAPTEVK